MRIRWWWCWWGAFTNRKAEEGVWVKNPKLSVHCSLLGVPYETAVWSDARRGWSHVDCMAAAGGLCVCQHEARGQDLGQKPETEHSSLGFGRAMCRLCHGFSSTHGAVLKGPAVLGTVTNFGH